MKKLINISALFLAAVALFASCQKEVEFKTTDKGPDMKVTCAESAQMGDSLKFDVTLNDPIALSTLKAKLYFDETVVDEVTIRTKTNGTYSAALAVPFLKNIPDGIATVVFTSQNIEFGLSEETVNVSVTRPDFDFLTLKLQDGTELRMEKTSKYNYSYTGSLQAETKATIIASDDLSFGWSGSEIVANATDVIPFSNGVADEYSVTFNTLTFAGSPFITLEANGTVMSMVQADRYAAVLNLKQNENIVISGYAPGFEGWTIDPDYLEEVSDGTYKFLAVNGLYKVTAEVDNSFFRVEPMANSTDYATTATDGTGALWLIGNEKVGKPTMNQGSSWNPEKGGLALAQVSPKVYQITLVAGLQLSADDVNFKFFHQKSWGGEFGFANITTDSDTFIISEPDNGNVKLAEGMKLTMGDIWKFTVTLASSSSAVLKAEKVGYVELPKPDVFFAGTKLEMTSPDQYRGVVDLTQKGSLSIQGVDNLSSWYLDPDFLDVTSSGVYFAATSGKYEVLLNTVLGTAVFNKMKSDGVSYADFSDGAIWLMGWGVAKSYMDLNQIGWGGEGAMCLAEISPKVYQFTAKAVGEHDATTAGGKIRFDYLSAKYFFIKGYDHGEMSSPTLTGAVKMDGGNLALDGALEEGATYRITIDLSSVTWDGTTPSGEQKITFVKL